MNYTIDWMERKTTSTGKEKIDATLRTPEGALTKTATIWSDFPGFTTLQPGGQVMGDLVEKGQYTTLYPTKAPAASTYRPRIAGGASGVKAAQERKGEMIAVAQETKNTGIKIAAAFRDATLLVIEILNQVEGEPLQKNEIFALHKEIRDWYIAGWGDTEKTLDVPFL